MYYVNRLHLALLTGVPDHATSARRDSRCRCGRVSRHTERDEEGSTATLRAYSALEEEAISAHRGHIFSRAGDGVVAEFPSIVEAIRCAVEIQNEINERNEAAPEGSRMRFRIGVNLGDVIA